MTVKTEPARLCGEIEAIASKSDVHRLLICAALADKPTEIILTGSMKANNLSDDIRATVDCLIALGAKIDLTEGTDMQTVITVTPIKKVPEKVLLDCGESGSTLRFILPVAAALISDNNEITVTGKGRLPDRPIKELTEVLKDGGISFSADKLPFTISGKLSAGTYEIPGNISSQYVTGLLLGLSAIGNDSIIRMTTPLQSAAYVDITLDAMSKFGVKIAKENGEFRLAGASDMRFVSPGSITADGDWSNAAFFLALKNLGHEVSVSGLNKTSPQGDKAIIDMLHLLAKDCEHREISLSEIPDLLPVMAVVAAFSKGETHFTNGERLRAKESDRLASVCELISKLGGKAQELPDGMIVYPVPLTGGEIDSHNDHRIVMAAAIAAANCTSPVIITGAEAVNKSYPTFFEDCKRLGGNIYVI